MAGGRAELALAPAAPAAAAAVTFGCTDASGSSAFIFGGAGDGAGDGASCCCAAATASGHNMPLILSKDLRASTEEHQQPVHTAAMKVPVFYKVQVIRQGSFTAGGMIVCCGICHCRVQSLYPMAIS